MKNTSNEPNSNSLVEIYLKARDKQSPEAREAYLEGACGDNVSLRDKVEALLRENAEDSFLESPAIEKGETLLSGPTESPGTLIGRYKILQSIGEGGFGSVYMAEQKEPVKRRVALKIIKLGMDTKQVVARFEAERQALAMMDHPNIAKVLDAGATEAGRPYFVMELVRGISITKYCDENHLSANERLDLFIQVCSAIQHAHQKGVIHRDIKPSNIMITLHDGQPVPKVIDFGIAKATQQELTEKTLFTQYSQFIGTPAYMSPEQAEMSGLDVDTRSDIYSLGVLLYKLLTGHTPLDRKELMTGGYDEIRRRIREEEPSKPSTRVSTMEGEERTKVGKHLDTDAAKLSHLLKGDLDWVVMKALEKDRTRRYETANALKLDIERFLINEPVTAVKPSTRYLLGKYMRRHKTVVGFAALIAILLIAATAISSSFAVKANRAVSIQKSLKKDAEQAQNEAITEKENAVIALEKAEAEEQRATELANKLSSQIYGINMDRAFEAIRAQNGIQAGNFLDQCNPESRGWEWHHLQLQTDQSSRTLNLSPRLIINLDVSPDGTSLVVDSHRYDPAIFDLLTGELIHESKIMTEDDLSKSIWHPHMDWIASTDVGGIQFWHPEKEGFRLEGDFIDLERILFNPDGSLLVVPHFAEPSGEISIWDVKEKKLIHRIVTEYHSPIVRPCISPDGKWLAAMARTAGDILVWNLKNLSSDEKPIVLSGHPTGRGMSLQFLSNGKYLVAGYGEGLIYGYDVQDDWQGFTIDSIEISGHSLGVFEIASSPDGAFMAAIEGSAVYLYHCPSFARVGKYLGHQGNVLCANFHPNGDMLITGDDLGYIKFWEIQQPQGTLKLAGHEEAGLRELQYSPDGAHLATTGLAKGDVRIWDVHSGTLLHAFSEEMTPDGIHWNMPDALDYSPDGQWLAVGDWESTNSCVIDANTGKVVQKLESPKNLVYIDFHPDGSRLAGASRQGEVLIWSIGSEQPAFRIQVQDHFPVKGPFKDNPKGVDGLVYSPDGAILAISVYQGPIALLNGETGELINHTSAKVNACRDVDFSPTMPVVAAGLSDGQIMLWSYQKNEPPTMLPGHSGGVFSIDFSPDGKRLVSGGSDGKVLIWDIENNRVIGELFSEPGRRWGVDFSPDGQSIATTGTNGFVYIFEAKPTTNEIAKQRLNNLMKFRNQR